jgi:nucleoside-diphosphate-sugar epimerase
VGDVQGASAWASSLQGADCVVHCAARTHAINESGMQGIEDYRSTNVEGTRVLAQAAQDVGVKRFVLLSSVKVLGERSKENTPLQFDSPATPEDAYGLSKWEAEQALQQIAMRSPMQFVVVRSPLVYGPGVKANFLRLMRAVDQGVWLPLASIQNRRSLVSVDNLVDLLMLCVSHPGAAGQTLLVSDGHDLSTPDLVREIAGALGRPARLLPCPPAWLQLAGRLTGRAEQVDRLIGSLQVDISQTRRMLGWAPPHSVCQSLKRTTGEWQR